MLVTTNSEYCGSLKGRCEECQLMLEQVIGLKELWSYLLMLNTRNSTA